MFGKEHSQLAAKQLNLPDDYQIIYQAVTVSHIAAVDDVIEQLKYEDDGEDICGMNTDDVYAAVNHAIESVWLPKGLRLVGMAPSDSDGKKLIYGFVDFSSLETA